MIKWLVWKERQQDGIIRELDQETAYLRNPAAVWVCDKTKKAVGRVRSPEGSRCLKGWQWTCVYVQKPAEFSLLKSFKATTKSNCSIKICNCVLSKSCIRCLYAPSRVESFASSHAFDQLDRQTAVGPLWERVLSFKIFFFKAFHHRRG